MLESLCGIVEPVGDVLNRLHVELVEDVQPMQDAELELAT